MSIYHKITELSIAIFSLTSLVFNFLFPHVALANNVGTFGKNSISFIYEETANVLPLVTVKNDISLVKVVGIGNKNEQGSKVLMLPIEQPVIKEKVKKVVISTSAKKISTVENIGADNSKSENDEIAEDICLAAGITDLPCWQDLRAMRNKESFDGKVMTGDNGRSRGWYHIQTKMHKISDVCALDFKCSTEWTVKNLITNGYKTNRFYAISRHNGGGIMAKNYAKSVVYNSAKFE